MLLLKRTTFEVESGSAHVTAGEAAAVARAEEIVSAAEAEAAKIVADAKAAFESERKRGYDTGIREAAMEMLDKKIGLVDESVRYIESIESKMAELVMKALKKCLAEIGDTECVCQIVKKAMQVIVRNQRQVTVRVAPEMVPAVKTRIAAIQAEFPSLAFVEVAEDAHLSSTACAVETEAGTVEASIEGQLEALEKSLRKHLTQDE